MALRAVAVRPGSSSSPAPSTRTAPITPRYAIVASTTTFRSPRRRSEVNAAMSPVLGVPRQQRGKRRDQSVVRQLQNGRRELLAQVEERELPGRRQRRDSSVKERFGPPLVSRIPPGYTTRGLHAWSATPGTRTRECATVDAVCGIAGRVNYAWGAPVEPSMLARMCDLIAHRGPDGDGVWCEGAVGLGHRRLAILDLSPLGRQPMATDDGRWSCVQRRDLQFSRATQRAGRARPSFPLQERHRSHPRRLSTWGIDAWDAWTACSRS